MGLEKVWFLLGLGFLGLPCPPLILLPVFFVDGFGCGPGACPLVVLVRSLVLLVRSGVFLVRYDVFLSSFLCARGPDSQAPNIS